MAILLPSLLKRISKTAAPAYRTSFELWIIRFAIFSNLIGFVLFGLATAGWQFYVIGFADSFGSVTLPMIRAVLSRSVDSHLQARLFSAIALVETFSGAFSPLIFGSLYGSTVGWMPNLIFFVIGGAYGVALLLTAGLRVKELILFGQDVPPLPSTDADGGETVVDETALTSASPISDNSDTTIQARVSAKTLVLNKLAEIEEEGGHFANRGV